MASSIYSLPKRYRLTLALLIGGLSFFSPRHGLVCDGIIEYEIILADGSIVLANASSHADLWRALQGGGNNFGVVTNFVARTFRQDRLIWAGYNYHPVSAAPQLLEAFHDLSKKEMFDEFATTWLGIGYSSKWRATAIASHVVYTKPQKRPQALESFMKARRFWSTVKLRSISDTGREMDSKTPPGYRYEQSSGYSPIEKFYRLIVFHRAKFMTTTFENNLTILTAAFKAFQASIESIRSVRGMTWSFVIQSLHSSTTAKSEASVLGFETDKNLVVVLVSASWTHKEDDQNVHESAEDLISKIETRAKELGVYNKYKYMNYAGSRQDPISGYGKENKQFLQDVSTKYDPQGIFQKVCIGGFKVF